MPVNYADAKIYKIEPICSHDESDVYYGSTCRVRLCDRYKGHLADYKQTHKKMTITSRFIFDKYKVENCHIVLVEAFPCANRDELTARESHYIRTLPCVNKCGKLSLEDIKENVKEYRKNHINEIKEKDKEYRKNHINEIKEYNSTHKDCQKEYYLLHKVQRTQYKLDNKVSIALTRKIYNEKNKVSLALKRKLRYEATKKVQKQ